MIIKRNQKGFTLIELMIVIAIIGILAAIAIPQFAAYRIRGFNSSAQSDVRNCATAEAAFFSDWQFFGRSDIATDVGGFGNGTMMLGPSDGANAFITGGGEEQLDATGNPTGVMLNVRDLTVGLGNLVNMVVSTPAGTGSSFTAAAKHQNGDTPYGADSDLTASFHAPGAIPPGTALVVGDLPVPLTDNDDFTDIGVGTETWMVR